jgi:hypothetical protein
VSASKKRQRQAETSWGKGGVATQEQEKGGDVARIVREHAPRRANIRSLGTGALYSRRFATVKNYFVLQGAYSIEEQRAC